VEHPRQAQLARITYYAWELTKERMNPAIGDFGCKKFWASAAA
jgi:hypothetical protein